MYMGRPAMNEWAAASLLLRLIFLRMNTLISAETLLYYTFLKHRP